MIRALALVLLLAGTAAAETWKPEKTWALMVGVLEWKDPNLASFPKKNRKDRVLEATLVGDGVPKDQIVFLEDQEATLARIQKELASVLAKAGEGSTLVFYFAGHGIQANGKTYFTNHDVNTGKPETAIDVDGLGAEIGKCFKGERVLLLADCCYSGALGGVVKKLPMKAACLTSATASNVSTGNWTFTESLIAALSGDGIVDANGDQSLVFSEVDDYVRREMCYREDQLTRGVRTDAFLPFTFRGVDPRKVRAQAAAKGPWKVGDYLDAKWNDSWWRVQVVGSKADEWKIHYLGYPESDDEWVAADRLRAIPTLKVKVGTKVSVEWKGKWYPASVEKTEDDRFFYIHYDDYGKEWDEWVTVKRMKLR